MAERILDVVINGKNNLSKALGEADKAVGGFTSRMERATGASQAVAASLAVAGAAVVALGVSSVRAANESENAQKRLETLLLNVSGATLAQADALRTLAAEQMKKTTLDDDAIIAGQSQLATFQLQADTIGQLTPALNDLAVSVYGVHVEQEQMIDMGNLLGKAMQGNVGALTRYGVTMTAAQEATIKTGTESERAAVMVDVLRQNFGGLAQGMRSTTSGQIEAARVAFGNLQEVMGAKLQPAIGRVAEAVTNFANRIAAFNWESFHATLDKWEPVLVIIAGAIVGALVPALWSAVVAIGATIVALGPFIAAGAAVAAVGYAFYKGWTENWGGIRDFTLGVWSVMRSAFDTVVNAISSAFTTVKNTIMAAIESIKSAIDAVLDRYQEAKNVVSGVDKNYRPAQLTPKAAAEARKKGLTGFAHGGVVPGTGASDSVLALLTPGEEVLTRDDPRHRSNSGERLSITVPVTVYGSDRKTAEQIGNLIIQKLRPALAFAR